MSSFRNFWWNLTHDSRDKELLIAELRRNLEAVQGRELELRRGEWVMRYFDMEADRDRWRKIADDLHGQVTKTFCWHCGHEWTRDYRVDELVATYRQAVVDAQEVRGAW